MGLSRSLIKEHLLSNICLYRRAREVRIGEYFNLDTLLSHICRSAYTIQIILYICRQNRTFHRFSHGPQTCSHRGVDYRSNETAAASCHNPVGIRAAHHKSSLLYRKKSVLVLEHHYSLTRNLMGDLVGIRIILRNRSIQLVTLIKLISQDRLDYMPALPVKIPYIKSTVFDELLQDFRLHALGQRHFQIDSPCGHIQRRIARGPVRHHQSLKPPRIP